MYFVTTAPASSTTSKLRETEYSTTAETTPLLSINKLNSHKLVWTSIPDELQIYGSGYMRYDYPYHVFGHCLSI